MILEVSWFGVLRASCWGGCRFSRAVQGSVPVLRSLLRVLRCLDFEFGHLVLLQRFLRECLNT